MVASTPNLSDAAIIEFCVCFHNFIMEIEEGEEFMEDDVLLASTLCPASKESLEAGKSKGDVSEISFMKIPSKCYFLGGGFDARKAVRDSCRVFQRNQHEVKVSQSLSFHYVLLKIQKSLTLFIYCRCYFRSKVVIL